jgi:hypothetical protein
MLTRLCDSELRFQRLDPLDRSINRDYYNLIRDELYPNRNEDVISIEVAQQKFKDFISIENVNNLDQEIEALELQLGLKVSTEFYLNFFQSRIKLFCDKVKSGNVAWDKSVLSVELWQTKSMHLIHYLTDLLNSESAEKVDLAFATLCQLVEATDECAESIFNAVEKFYYNLVKPQFIKQEFAAGNLSLQDLVHINMTHIRNRVFDKLYGMLPTNETIQGFFFFMEFGDKHDQSYIRRSTQSVLHLSSDDGLTSGDLSRESVDALKELGASGISWLGYRLLLSCDQEGYSVNGIINELWEQLKNFDKQPLSMQDATCPVAFNAYTCLRHWANSIQDANLKQHIDRILDKAKLQELDTHKFIKAMSENSDAIGAYIANKLNGPRKMSLERFRIDLDCAAEDDDFVQSYITKTMRSLYLNNPEHVKTMVSGLRHSEHSNVRTYISKRTSCNIDGSYDIEINEFLAELREFQTNKQIRAQIRQKIDEQYALERDIKSIMAVMLVDTNVLQINRTELQGQIQAIIDNEAPAAKPLTFSQRHSPSPSLPELASAGSSPELELELEHESNCRPITNSLNFNQNANPN